MVLPAKRIPLRRTVRQTAVSTSAADLKFLSFCGKLV